MPRPPTSPGSLVTRKEIEKMTGLSRQRIYQITEEADFPRPVDNLWPTEGSPDGTHPIWKRTAVEKHLKAKATARSQAQAERPDSEQ